MKSKGSDRRSTRGRASFALLVAAVTGSVLISGCGGGGSEEDPTRTGFIADAEAICAQASAGAATREADFNQALKTSDLEAAAQDFEDQASEVDAMLDQLEALSPPEADQATVTEIIALGRKRVAAAQEAADAIASGDKDGMIAAGKKGATLAGQYDQLASGFGFTACAGAGSSDAGATGTTGATGAAS